MTKQELEQEVERLRAENARLIDALANATRPWGPGIGPPPPSSLPYTPPPTIPYPVPWGDPVPLQPGQPIWYTPCSPNTC